MGDRDAVGDRAGSCEIDLLGLSRRLVAAAAGKLKLGAYCVTDQNRNRRERERRMGERKSGQEEAVKDVVEGVKGKAKEVAGAVTGRDDI